MKKFILQRLGYAVISLAVITTLSFWIICMKPGDPIASKVAQLPESGRQKLVKKYGLDKPDYQRFGSYIKGLITEFNLGDSIIYDGRNVNMLISSAGMTSAKVGGIALILEVMIGVVLGMVCGVAHGKWGDRLITVLVVLAICIPSFVFCALLQYYLGFKFKMAPILGWGKPIHYLLPFLLMLFPVLQPIANI